MTVLLRALLALAALVVAAGASLVAAAAIAAPVPETGHGGLLTLHADPYPARNMTIARGDRLLWPVTAELDAPSAGELTVRVTAAQPLAEDAAALRFELAACSEAWVLPSTTTGSAACAGGAGDIVIPEAPFATTDASRSWSLGDIVPGEPRYFLVTLSLPLSTPGALADEPAEVAFGFAAAAAETETGEVGGSTVEASGLALTGGMYLGPVLLGIGLLGGGFVLARLRLREES
jgi:hypothetical protein